VAPTEAPPTTVDWELNGAPGNSRFSPLDQINRSDVSRLKVAWTYDSATRLT
jgi:glucose dehydrogenase